MALRVTLQSGFVRSGMKGKAPAREHRLRAQLTLDVPVAIKSHRHSLATRCTTCPSTVWPCVNAQGTVQLLGVSLRCLLKPCLQENKVPKGPEEEAEGLSRQLSEVGRAASNQDSGDDVARSSLGAGDKPTLRSSFKKQRSVRLTKAGGLSELLTADAQMDQLSGDGDSGRWTRPG